MSRKIKPKYLRRIEQIPLQRTENGTGPMLQIRGDGILATESFMVQVYDTPTGLKLNTNDQWTLDRLLRGKAITQPNGKKLVEIDDAGTGFPLGGVLCGAHKEGEFYLREVGVEWFRGKGHKFQSYTQEYRRKVSEIIEAMDARPDDTLVYICPGNINVRTKNFLRNAGYIVEIMAIEDPLQTWLEEEQRKYVAELVGEDIYYDPKGMEPQKIAEKWRGVMQYARENRLYHMLKSPSKGRTRKRFKRR